METRHIIPNRNYSPLPLKRGDEIFSIGVFKINITKIAENIKKGCLVPVSEHIIFSEWFKNHSRRGTIHESHLLNVDTSKPVIQAEIKPEYFELIDGNHRMIKALRQGAKGIDSYKLSALQLLPFFTDRVSYENFVEFWNDELKCELLF